VDHIIKTQLVIFLLIKICFVFNYLNGKIIQLVNDGSY
jgi:hypothetical protein